MGLWKPFERRGERLISSRRFLGRMALHGAWAAAVVGVSLAVGVVGYHLTQGLGWLDALLNAAMILSGMGPTSPLTRPAAKLFASFYALYSGIVLIAVMGLVLGPVFHRVLHRFHVDESDDREPAHPYVGDPRERLPHRRPRRTSR